MWKKANQSSVIFLCGILFLLLGVFSWKSKVVVFSAEKGVKESEYKSPVLLEKEQPFSEKWYSKKPNLKLVHSEQRAVTKYCLISASGKKTEGVLEMEEPKAPEKPENPEQPGNPETPENPGEAGNPEQSGNSEISKNPENQESPDESGQKKQANFRFPWEGNLPEKPEEEEPEEKPGEVPQPVEKNLSAELFDEGINTLYIWMELKESVMEEVSNRSGNSGKTALKKEIYRKEYHVKIDLSIPEKVEFQYPSDDSGKNIYCASAVTIGLETADKVSGIREIVYSLQDGEAKKLTGGAGKVLLPLGYQGRITAYAVDLAGNSSEKVTSRAILCEDEIPQITLQTEGGFDGWHTKVPEIRISVKDPEQYYGFSTGIAKVTGYVDGKQVYSKTYEKEEKTEEAEGSFSVGRSSQGGKPVDVMVRAVDNAGNVSVKSEKLYIDIQSPQIQTEGIHDQQITAEKLNAEISIIEENCLQEGKVTVIRITPEGRKESILDQKFSGITEKNAKRTIPFEADQDGTYEIVVIATDDAGHQTNQKMKVILDQTNPAIKYVNQLEGSYVPYFKWNYEREDMISDFTEYTCQMYFDGKNYFAGERREEEGRHLLQVKAKDAAGNESSAEATFTIDHTAPKIYWGNLKEGESYEESVMLSVWVDQEEERIAEILINGEKQKLSPNSQIYQYEVVDSGLYKVKVIADDLAGNRRTEQKNFTVTEKKSIIQKVMSPVIKPVKTLLVTEKEEKEEGEARRMEENESDKTMKMSGILFILLVLGSGSAFIIRRKIKIL